MEDLHTTTNLSEQSSQPITEAEIRGAIKNLSEVVPSPLPEVKIEHNASVDDLCRVLGAEKKEGVSGITSLYGIPVIVKSEMPEGEAWLVKDGMVIQKFSVPSVGKQVAPQE